MILGKIKKLEKLADRMNMKLKIELISKKKEIGRASCRERV